MSLLMDRAVRAVSGRYEAIVVFDEEVGLSESNQEVKVGYLTQSRACVSGQRGDELHMKGKTCREIQVIKRIDCDA